MAQLHFGRCGKLDASKGAVFSATIFGAPRVAWSRSASSSAIRLPRVSRTPTARMRASTGTEPTCAAPPGVRRSTIRKLSVRLTLRKGVRKGPRSGPSCLWHTPDAPIRTTLWKPTLRRRTRSLVLVAFALGS